MLFARDNSSCPKPRAHRRAAEGYSRDYRRYVHSRVDEMVEQRNFRRRVQQREETFDDFLIALRELVKTCKFCSEDCTKKNIHYQIINDGDTVEDLLQIANLTLTTIITKCQSREAARRHRSNMSVQDPDTVAALCRPYQTSHQATATTTETCPGYVTRTHRRGRRQCPAYNQVC